MEKYDKIFNTEDQNEMKKAFKEIVIAQFKDDLEQNGLYLFDSNVIEELVIEAFKEVIDEVRDDFKNKLKEEVFKSDKIDKILAKLFVE